MTRSLSSRAPRAVVFSLVFTASVLAQSSFPADQTPGDRAQPPAGMLKLRYGSFDPLLGSPEVPADLAAGTDTNLRIVQFDGQVREWHRQALRDAGAEIFSYLHDNAFVVRMDRQEARLVADQVDVRFVGDYQPAYRLESFLLAEHATGEHPWRRYNIIVTDPADKAALIANINGIEGSVDRDLDISIRMEVSLNGAQLMQVARMDQVLWIDRYEAPEHDMNNARQQGGAAAIEAAGNFRGQGVRGEIYEGVEIIHPDFAGPGRLPPIVHRSATPSNHGHCTFGIVFGNGSGNSQATGMMPEGQGIVANHSTISVSRTTVVFELRNIHSGMFQTASWGNGRTTAYTSISAELDDIIFRFDMPITQSQSNAGDRMSRPQAWAKNVISVGGVRHGNNTSRADDNWTGGASIGPAEDGRIKPDLVAYYDSILCTDRLGSNGYQPGDYNPNFGGTSGATPIVAGHLGLTIQMFGEGVFGNQPNVPGGTMFENKPHFTTSKALLINTARQYPFSGLGHDLTRVHQGWGFPDLAHMHAMRGQMLIIDETDVLTQGEVASYVIDVPPNQPRLQVTMVYADPAGNPATNLARINNLDLRVISPDTSVYHGNHGLRENNFSLVAGTPDTVDTVENVFISNPVPGNWIVEVTAASVNVDAHLETGIVDVDFALVVTGGTASTCEAEVAINGPSCPDALGLPTKLSWQGCFALGETVKLQMTGFAIPGSTQLVVLGNNDQNWLGIPLPLDLALIGSPGCMIYNDQDRSFDVSGPISGGSIELRIPDSDPSLIGSTFFWQGVIVTPSGNGVRVFTTNQLETTLGG